MSQNFKLDTTDYLGISYTSYKNDLMQLALTNPNQYYELRKNVLEAVKIKAISNLYDTIYSVLTDGEVSNGVSAAGNATAAGIFKPHYPKQEVTKVALSASQTMQKIIDDVVDIILPLDYTELAKQRLARKGEARGINP